MNILAIESASTVCGVALFLNNRLIELDEIRQSRIHGARLPVIIHDILNNYSVNIDQLNGIAISSGPGSYTGLRIGMNLARGLAAAGTIPIIPVPTLSAMNIYIKKKGIYLIMLHSHKNQFYMQRFNSGEPDSEITIETFQPQGHKHIYGFNLGKYYDSYIVTPPSAKAVGILAIQNFHSWREHDIDKISPNYVKNYNL